MSIGRLYRRRRTSRQFHRMILQRLHYLGYRALELWILAGQHRPGIVLDLDVGIDAVAFDDPLTFGACERRLRHEDRASVDQRAPVPDADHAAPRAFADQRTEPSLTKHRRENIAVRSGILIQKRGHRSKKHATRISAGFIERSRVVEREHLSSQALDQ